MAEDLGERTEQPTEKRLREAREKGQAARSTDLSAAIILAAAVGACFLFARYAFVGSAGLMRRGLSEESLGNGHHPGTLAPAIAAAFSEGVRIAAPVMALLCVVALAGGAAQVGLHVAPQAMAPKWSRLNPVSGLKRLFGRRSAVKGGIDFLKFALIAAVVVVVVRGQHREILALPNLDVLSALIRSAELVRDLSLWVIAVLIVLALLDFRYQRWQHHEDLKMTKHEVKDERRSTEGDPETKARRLKIARQVALQRLGIDVPRADVVVTNPTHFAVALKYDPDAGMRAPRVIAKGADYLALKMRYIAQSAGVPIVERPPLARALYHQVAVGREIYPEHYEAVAEVLAYVYRLSREREAAGVG